jgi:riboflavin synthase
MFTGIIEESGTVVQSEPQGDGVRLTIAANVVMDDLAVDHSIAVNGVCLTVTDRTATTFSVTAVAETLRKTTTGALTEGSIVNLERAVRMSDRLGGHLVQGHVDTVGSVRSIIENESGWEVWFSYPIEYRRWLIPVGSVCVEGVSLTVAAIDGDAFKVAIIPHTLQKTTLGSKRVGDRVNIEFDMVAKYVANHVG